VSHADLEAIRLLTVAEAARALAVSDRSLRMLISTGALPVVRVGARSVRIHPQDLERFIAQRRGSLGT